MSWAGRCNPFPGAGLWEGHGRRGLARPGRSGLPDLASPECCSWRPEGWTMGFEGSGTRVSCCLRRLLGLIRLYLNRISCIVRTACSKIHANFAGIAVVCCPVGSANPAASLRDQK
jgi:hypothetical protein